MSGVASDGKLDVWVEVCNRLACLILFVSTMICPDSRSGLGAFTMEAMSCGSAM